MELPGHVAVVDGILFPLAEWEVEVVRDTVSVNSLNQFSQAGAVVDAEHFDGRIVAFPARLPECITARPVHKLYLFPKSGTDDRVELTGVIFGTVEYSDAGQTITIEFSANKMER